MRLAHASPMFTCLLCCCPLPLDLCAHEPPRRVRHPDGLATASLLAASQVGSITKRVGYRCYESRLNACSGHACTGDQGCGSFTHTVAAHRHPLVVFRPHCLPLLSRPHYLLRPFLWTLAQCTCGGMKTGQARVAVHMTWDLCMDITCVLPFLDHVNRQQHVSPDVRPTSAPVT